jgi:RimJ/RimL family protein N-acetyltransferase
MPHIWSASQTPGFNDGLAWDPPSNIEELDQPLVRSWKTWANGTAYSWTAESQKHGTFIGKIVIRREAHPDEWSIGFWIHPEVQRRGYASEIGSAIVEFGFKHLHAEVISAAHATWNVISGKVLENIGMTRVRTNPKGFKKGGEWVEEFVYEVRAG